jgi:hypothetical protein
MTFDDDDGRFAQLHNLFTFHLGVAVGLSWLTSLYASLHAPWVRNIRPLIDPSYSGQVESTWSFLFIFPVVLTLAWISAFYGRSLMLKLRMLKNQTLEFAVAAVVAFALFYLSVDRAVSAILAGS